MNTWREVFLCSFEWCLPHQPHPLLLQWSCCYMTPSFHHPRVWSCILLSQIWIQLWSHLYKRAHTPHLQDELHWCQGRGSFCFPQSLQWNHCGMQFLGLKSKGKYTRIYIKKKNNNNNQKLSIMFIWISIKAFFFIFFQEMVFTCVRGFCSSKIYNKTSKEIQTFPFSLGT